MQKRQLRCLTRNHVAVGYALVSIGVGAAGGWAVSQAGAGCGWEVAEGEDSIGTAEIGRVLAGMRAGWVMVMAREMESIGVDCSVVEACAVAVWDQWQLVADLAVAVEEAVGYTTAAPDAQAEK